MAKKSNNAKAKAKRQKIILAVLGVVFLAVLAWQVPSVIKIMNKKPVPAATTPPPAAVPAPAPVVGAPGTPLSGTPVAAPVTPATGLTDSDPAAQAANGQLVSFDRFASKDPFQQQAGFPATASPTSVAGTQAASAPASGSTATADNSTSSSKPTPPAQPTSAQIAVNGSSEQVTKGAAFPQADPVFELLSVSTNTVKVGISGGSLASGGATVTLKKGKKLTLENTVDGARYVLLLISTG